MDDLFRHEKLAVWQRAKTLTKELYILTRSFPADERFGLTSQIRRASGSVAHNIAEGNGRSSVRDKCRFLEIAYGSLLETVSELSLAVDLEFLTASQVEPFRREADEIARMIVGLRRRYERGD